jgi:hypothetical protein
MNCPICRKGVDRTNPEYPFCGERCRVIDLGNWASEKYRIPVKAEYENEENGATNEHE